MPSQVFRTASLSAFIFIAACGDDIDDRDPIAYSETLSIRLSGIKEGDVRDGTASEDKNVNTEEGNPYAAFLSDARDALDGADPSGIRVSDATLRIHSDTEGVTRFDEVFDGSIEVFLANSATTIAIGEATMLDGSSADVTITAGAAELEPLQDSLLGGDIKVGVRGAAVDDLPDDFDLKISIDLGFEALP